MIAKRSVGPRTNQRAFHLCPPILFSWFNPFLLALHERERCCSVSVIFNSFFKSPIILFMPSIINDPFWVRRKLWLKWRISPLKTRSSLAVELKICMRYTLHSPRYYEASNFVGEWENNYIIKAVSTKHAPKSSVLLQMIF